MMTAVRIAPSRRVLLIGEMVLPQGMVTAHTRTVTLQPSRQ
jgi:hypothetical protein